MLESPYMIKLQARRNWLSMPLSRLFFLCYLCLFAISGGTTVQDVCNEVKNCTTTLDTGGTCPILPIATSNLVPPGGPAGFNLVKLREGVWAYLDGTYSSLILKAGTRLALIDFPDSSGSNKPDGGTRVIDAAQQVLNGDVPKRIDMIYSHAHFDHIGASPRFHSFARKAYPTARISIWGTAEIFDLIKYSVTKRAIAPNVIIGRKGRTLTLSKGLKVTMKIISGHTASDLVMYIPRYKDESSIAMLVDVVFPKWVPPVDLSLTVSVGRYIRIQKQLLKMKFDIFVGGHLGVGRKSDVAKNLNYTEDLVQAALTAVASVTGKDLFAAGLGLVSDPSAREFGNIWFAVVDVQLRVQADACYRIMLEKWGCKLAGIDRFLRNHCLTAIFYLSTEY